MSEPITLAIHCKYCGGAMTLQMVEWPSEAASGVASEIKDWLCPYCERLNAGEMPGRLAWATRGHERQNPEIH